MPLQMHAVIKAKDGSTKYFRVTVFWLGSVYLRSEANSWW